MDRLTSMAVFVKTAELGSFAAAADTFGISPQMAAKHVRALESRLGAPLILRTTRRHALTELGRLYHQRCRRVLDEVQAAEALAGEHQRELAGALRITLPLLLGRRLVAPILLPWAQQHRRLQLQLRFSDLPEDLMSGQFDLAIRNGEPPDSHELVARRVFEQAMVVCAAPQYLARHGTPAAPDALAGHETIGYGRPGQVRTWLFPEGKQPARQVQPRARLCLDDLGAIADAAAAGAGIAWLPRWLVAGELDSGALVALLQDRPPMVFHTHAIWPRTPQLPTRVRAALELVTRQLQAAQ